MTAHVQDFADRQKVGNDAAPPPANGVAGGPPPGFYDDTQEGPPTTTEAEKTWASRRFVLDPAWQSQQPPTREWLLTDLRTKRGVLPMRIAAQLIAAGGVGKSMVAVQLAIAVATGLPWLGTFATRKGRVLLIMGEEDTGTCTASSARS